MISGSRRWKSFQQTLIGYVFRFPIVVASVPSILRNPIRVQRGTHKPGIYLDDQIPILDRFPSDEHRKFCSTPYAESLCPYPVS